MRGLLQQTKSPLSLHDWDFTTNAHPDEIQRLFPHSFYENKFGTVGVPVTINGEQSILEITTYRYESAYTNDRHPDEVTWAPRLEDDLARRDFTINAMAYDGTQLVDPYGGLHDMHQGIVRAVGDPRTRFSEDALRLMRAVRQATQLRYIIEPETLRALTEAADRIQNISGERIRDELFKLLQSPYAADGVMLLKNTGLLAYILPEVMRCFGVEQKSPNRHHIYDVGTHLIQSLRHCDSSDPVTKLATLIHDVGKYETFQKDPDSGQITFYNHEVIGARHARIIADRLKLSKEARAKLVTLVRHHQFTVNEDQSDKALRRFIRNVGAEHLRDMIALRVGDRLGSGARRTSWRTELFLKRLEEVQKTTFTLHDLAVSGHEVMQVLGMKPGKELGNILKSAFEKVDEGVLPNESAALLEWISQEYSSKKISPAVDSSP